MRNLLIVLIFSVLQLAFKIPATFQGDFSAALKHLVDQKEAIQKVSEKHTVNKAKVLSIVSPELIRYSLFRDFFETKALENIYVRYGKEEADFSIGPFQMKPSFIEKLEQYVRCDPVLSIDFQDLTKFETNKDYKIRKQRIERLKNFDWQLEYAFCFFAVMERYYGNYPFKDKREQLRFYATAYNFGFTKPFEEIKAWMDEKAFPYGKKFETEQAAYHEFSIAFYEKLNNNLKISP